MSLELVEKQIELFETEKPVFKLDFGCGPNPTEGFTGVDIIKFNDKIQQLDIRENWPWEDGSVIEAKASHFVEHLTARERVHFVNELYRVMAPGASCQVITPHWASCRAYGDPTHQWPPVCEFWFMYLNKEWREQQAPHTDIKHNPDGYKCDFEITHGYSLRGDIIVRSQEHQMFAISNYKEVCQDMIANFKKK